jgi:hypothetical protein
MFEYKPLDVSRNEIRLITILPRQRLQRRSSSDDPNNAPRSSSSSSSGDSWETVSSTSQSHSEEGEVVAIQRGLNEAHVENPPLVHCQLEHVSLDEFTPKYLSFLEGPNEESWTADTYLKWMKLLLNEQAKEHVEDLAVKDRERWKWGDYFALSYVWGDATARRMIILNGIKVSMSENLEAALQEMSIHIGGFKIWIDALCINQNDLTERSHEVKRMRKIYRGASRVIAWMGPKTQDTHLAFQVINGIATEAWNTDDHLPGEEVPVLWNSIRTDRSKYTDRQWHAFGTFLELPYWSRVWIIQELAMSNLQAVILWEDESCTLLNLAKAY